MAALAWALSLVQGCSGNAEDGGLFGSDPGTGGGTGGASGSTPEGGVAAVSDLPCDVAALLATHCQSCHSNPPIGAAPMPMMTRADLMAPSRIDPTSTVAARALVRMRASVAPMPPPPAAPVDAVAIAAMDTWVSAGMPAGGCSSAADVPDAGPSPYATPTMCSSGTYWNAASDEGSRNMMPGATCIACHSRSSEAPRFVVAGTVYPSAHEPDNCSGGTLGMGTATVEVTDATGQVFTMNVSSAGNFFMEARAGSVTLPVTARVHYAGRVRAMTTPAASGDCNSCHTESGTMGAPGRIMLP